MPALQPLTTQVCSAIDQISRYPRTDAELDEAVRIGARDRAHHQQEIGLPQELLDGVLAVLRGIADVLLMRCREPGEAPLQGGDDIGGVIDRERGLGDESEPGRIGHLQGFSGRHGLDQADLPTVRGVEAPERAFDLRVAVVTDQDHIAALAAIAPDLHMHLGD